MIKFEKGDIRVFALKLATCWFWIKYNSPATYVILWHAMRHEEEKQILGRAYRMGRDKPLHFVKHHILMKIETSLCLLVKLDLTNYYLRLQYVSICKS
jgi:hypothetical protein